MTRLVGWAGKGRLRRPGSGLALVAAVVTMIAGPAGAAVAAPGHAGPVHAIAVRPVGKPPGAGRRAGIPLPMTRDSRTVRHANGRYTTTIYPGAVNYHTAQGWRRIDSALVPAGAAGFAWRNKANAWTSWFARRAGSEYLRLRVAGQVFDFDADGAASAAGKARGSHLSYPGAWPGADLAYDVSAGAVGETIVLHDSSALASYDFAVRARGGRAPLTARRLADGSWEVFRAPAGGPVFVLQAPVAADAEQATPGTPPSPGRPHASMTVRGHGSWLAVRIRVDRKWLSAPGRQFPVRVDPTITIQPGTQDASFPANCGNCAPYHGDRLLLGSDNTYVWRAALQFDLSSIPPGAQVTGAQVGLYDDGWCFTSTTGCGFSHVFEAHRMTAAWSPSSTSSQLAFDSTTLSTVSVTDGQVVGWLYWPVTGMVQNWLSGAQPNDGLLLKQSAEPLGSGGVALPSSSYAATSSVQPELQVTYTSDAVTLEQPTTLHSNGAELNWTPYTGPSGAPFQQYAVYRSLTPRFTPSPSTLLTTITDPSVTSWTDTTAAPDATFTYAVVANSDKSNEVTVTLPADGQATKTLQPDPATAQDTYILYSPGITNCGNYGTDQYLYVGSNASGIFRGLMRFNLNDIPASATITNATLSIWQEYWASTAVTLEAHRVTRAWTQGTGTASGGCTGDGATWYDATTGVQWTGQGGDYDPAVAASLSKPANQTSSWDRLDITSLAQQWTGGAAPNLGVLLKLSSEPQTAGDLVSYYSGDFALNSGLRPYLTVTYTDGSHAPPPTAAVSAPAPGATVSGTAVTLAAAAADDGAIDHVDFLVDGTVVGTATTAPYTLSWDSATASNGSHTITARAVDTAGQATTSSPVTVTVGNVPAPTVSVTSPKNSATVSGTSVAVTAAAAATSPNTVSKVDFYCDNQLIGTATSSPYTVTWNTLDTTTPAYDGTHALTAKVTDSGGQVTTSSAVTVTVANTAGTIYQAGIILASGSAVPATATWDPPAGSQQQFGVKVTITNNSKTAFSSAGDTLAYRWYSPDSPPVVTTGPATPLGTTLNPGKSVTVTVLVSPPSLPDGVNSAQYTLMFDLYDSASSSWFAAKGNPPVTSLVQVLRKSPVGLGLEKYYQYDTQPLGAGLDSLVNVASGNLALNMTPWQLPGRGLASMLELTYNGLENHSHSPAGNNWSLAISSLTRFGTPLDIHPNNADSIAGVSDKMIGVTDGDGTLHVYTGTTNPDGTTTWTPPPGFNLYLRSTTTDTTSPSYWALSRPDHVTFYYNYAGWPTSVVDKNGNTITFTETATPPGEDPGGPAYRITKVTDPGGRSITLTYYTKAQTDNAHQRGRISDITDYAGHVLHFDYYRDGNLLRITQRGGTNADGSFLPDRSWVFTYMNSPGTGPAIPNAADRVNPDPKTPNEDSQIYSVRDPRGDETTYAYYLNSDGPNLAGRVKTLTDRDGNTTSYGYDLANSVTTVTDPLGHATKYTYDGSGRVTMITNPLGQNTSQAWTADNKVRQITEDNGAIRSYSYNANGFLTDYTDQDGNHTVLSYLNRPLDSTDTGTHWSLLAAKTAPNGTVQGGSGFQWQFSYDAAGNLITAQDPLGNQTHYCYNLGTAPSCNPANDPSSPGTVESVTDFNGNTTVYANYDPSGQPQKVTDPLGRVTQFGFDADGNLLFTQDPLHAGDSGSDTRSYRTVYDYDSFNRLGRVSQPKSTALDRGTLIWTDSSYDPDNNVTAVQDAHYGQQDAGDGAVTSHSYDPMDRLTLTTTPDTQADPTGQRTRMAYDAAGRLTSVVLPMGVLSGTAKDHTTSYGYDAASELTSQTQYAVNSSGTVTDTRVTYYCYDDVGNTVSVTAPNAQLPNPPACPATSVPNTTFYAYDNAHQRMSVTDPNGNTHSVVYDGDGNVTQSTDANGNTTVSTYDQKDQLIKVVAPFVHGGRTTTTEYVYDANGNKIKDISPRAYDVSPDKITFTNYVTGYSYDADNELVTQATPTDASTPAAYIHYYYDAGGRQTGVSLPVTQDQAHAAEVPADAITSYSYFDQGWIATSQDPAAPAAVHFDYTAQGWQTTRIPENPSGGLDTALEQNWTYYPDGKTATYTDQGGQASTYHYDADNNLTYATTAHGLTGPGQSPIEIYADYTPFDQLAATHYRPTSSSTYTGTAYTYDHDGNVTERDDNAQQTLASVTKNGQGVPVSWTFTQTGPPDVNTMTYDPADWLKTQNDKGTTSSCTADKRIDTTWTPNGQEATSTINIADSSCTYSPRQATAWAYFDNGLLHTQSTTNGNGTVLETHTLDYQANGIYMNGNRTSDAYSLNGPGSTACTGTTPACTASYSYNARDQLVSAADGHGGTTTYTYDQAADLADPSIQAGNITTQTSPAGTTTSTYTGDQLTTTATGGVTSKYWYDGLGRLTCVTTTSGTAASCDTTATGNTSVSPAVITATSYDFMDRFTATHTYSNGTAVSSASYSYDALDRTAAETETHNAANLQRTTTFSYEGMTNLATQEVQATTGATTSTDTKTYDYDVYGTRISLGDSTVSGGTTTAGNFLYGYNTHGDVSLLTDQSNGTVRASYGYTSYGAPDTTLSKNDTSLTTPFNPYQYSAKRFDSGSATYDMGVRRYDPSAQRFLQADQFQGALADLALSTDPLTQNRYDLAASNPLSAIEWDGHVTTLAAGGGGGPAPTPPPPTISTGYINLPRFGPIGNGSARPVGVTSTTSTPGSAQSDNLALIARLRDLHASLQFIYSELKNSSMACTGRLYYGLGVCPSELAGINLSLVQSGISGKQILLQMGLTLIPGGNVLEGADAGSQVLFDTNAIIAFKSASAALRTGEVPVVSETTVGELADVAARKGFSGALPAGVGIIADDTSIALRARMMYQLRLVNSAEPGIFGDAAIGATALARDMPLVTQDAALYRAIENLGGQARTW